MDGGACGAGREVHRLKTAGQRVGHHRLGWRPLVSSEVSVSVWFRIAVSLPAGGYLLLSSPQLIPPQRVQGFFFCCDTSTDCLEFSPPQPCAMRLAYVRGETGGGLRVGSVGRIMRYDGRALETARNALFSELRVSLFFCFCEFVERRT